MACSRSTFRSVSHHRAPRSLHSPVDPVSAESVHVADSIFFAIGSVIAAVRAEA